MPEYLSPGVYVEEINAGPKPIEGVSTSTVGAVGVTARGPTDGKPILVTSFNEFTRNFGGYLKPPDDQTQIAAWSDAADGGYWWQFPLAVKGFFDNGGKRMYVKRVVSGKATAASAQIGQALTADIERVVDGDKWIYRLRHLFGISTDAPAGASDVPRKGLQFNVDGTLSPSIDILWYDPSARTIQMAKPPGKVKPARDYIQIIPSTLPADATKVSLTFTAKEKGDAGNALRVRVRPVVGATLILLPDKTDAANAAFTSRIKTVDPSTWTVKIDPATLVDDAGQVTIGGKKFTASKATPADDHFTVTADVASALSWSNGVTMVTGKIGGNVAQAKVTDVKPNPPVAPATPFTVAINVDPPLSAAPPAGQVVFINGQPYVLAAASTTSQIKVTVTRIDEATWPSGTVVQGVQKARVDPSGNVGVAEADRLYVNALVEFDNGLKKEYAVVTKRVDNTTVTVDKDLTGLGLFAGHRIRVVEAEVNVQQVFTDGSEGAQETHPNLRLSKDDSQSYIVTWMKQKSALVKVEVGQALGEKFDALNKFPSAPGNGWVSLDSGSSGLAGLKVDDFVGEDGGSGNRSGIQALEDIDEISICIAPGMWSQTVRDALINHCERLKDRFAIIDTSDRLGIGDVRDFRSVLDTKYAALYYPWLFVRDQSQSANVRMAPSGHMAGLYARVDNDRGVFKAPANEIIQGIVKIADDVNQREQDVLNPIGINALRFFPDRGYRVWGARTLSSDSSWKYINVRRLFIFLEKSIYNGTQFVVFEPNDAGTHAKVRQTIGNFLNSVWRSGALQGLTPAEAYSVRCDLGVTMTQDDIDNGRLICEIAVAPVKPAEFVIFRIEQKTAVANP